jgi:hypothetical protein
MPRAIAAGIGLKIRYSRFPERLIPEPARATVTVSAAAFEDAANQQS